MARRRVISGRESQLAASVTPVKNTSMYEGRIKPSDGDWMPSVFTDVTPYLERLRAVKRSTKIHEGELVVR